MPSLFKGKISKNFKISILNNLKKLHWCTAIRPSSKFWKSVCTAIGSISGVFSLALFSCTIVTKFCYQFFKKFYDSGNLKRHVEGVHSSKDANDFSEKLLDSSPSLLSPILKSENSLLSLLPQPSPPKSEKSDLSEGEIKSALLAAIRSGSKSPDSDPDQPPIIHNIDSEGQTYTCDRCLLRYFFNFFVTKK